MLKATLGILLIYGLSDRMLASANLIRCTANDIGFRFAHPSSCSLFIVCTSNLKIDIRSCPKGLYFNSQQQVCDLPQRVDCLKQTIKPIELCDACDCNVCCSNCGLETTTILVSTTEELTTTTVKFPDNPKTTTAIELSTTEVTSKSSDTTTPVSTTTTLEFSEPTTTPGSCGCIGESSTSYSPDTTTTTEVSTTTILVTPEPLTTPGNCGCTAESSTSEEILITTTSNIPSTPDTTTTIEMSTTMITTETSERTTPVSTTSKANDSPDTTTTIEMPTTTISSVSSDTTTLVSDDNLDTSTTTTTPSSCGCTGEKNTDPDLPEPSITPTPIPTTRPTVLPIENCDKACCGQRNGATFALEGDCQSFIICLGQRQTLMKCPNNLHYSITGSSCDFPQNANCQWSYMPPSGPAAGPSGTHCTYGGRCVGQSDGTTFNNENELCSSEYFVCQCECEVPRSCSAPLMFNSKNNVCDWPKNLGCQ